MTAGEAIVVLLDAGARGPHGTVDRASAAEDAIRRAFALAEQAEELAGVLRFVQDILDDETAAEWEKRTVTRLKDILAAYDKAKREHSPLPAP